MKLPLQPTLVLVGPNLSSISASYVQIENVRYQMRTPITALDTCFKAFFALDAAYPSKCRAIWQFIQQFFYAIHLKEDQHIPRVTSVISSLSGMISAAEKP